MNKTGHCEGGISEFGTFETDTVESDIQNGEVAVLLDPTAF
jgi:hypothetical protein